MKELEECDRCSYYDSRLSYSDPGCNFADKQINRLSDGRFETFVGLWSKLG